MKQFFSMLALLTVGFCSSVSAQIVETRPTPLQQSSKDVVVVYHADQGSKGLMGLTTGVYAHTGVITNKSNGEWAYAPSKWGDNDPKYALTYVGADTWELNIGDIRTYYGITEPDEVVEKLAFVFRSSDCSKEGKTADGGDIFIDVHNDFALELKSDASDIMMSPSTVNFTVSTTDNASISLLVDGTEVASVNGTSLTKAVDMKEYRNYMVKAIAKTADGKSVEKEQTYLVAPASQQRNFPGGTPKMGVTVDGSKIIFCLAAPEKKHVLLVGSWDGYAKLAENVMSYQDVNGQRYFWTELDGYDPSKDYIYYYIVDGTIKVADPYSRLVLDPYSDKWLSNKLEGVPSYPYDLFDDTVLSVWRGDMNDYDWKYNDSYTIPDHDRLVIYELLLRDFTGTHGTDDGTLKAARGHLSYLREMGVNVIELMPIQEFNGNNSWGYNPNFYFAPDKAYGSPAEYKEFIDDCHRHGFSVVLDVVFNQSDGLHPWYRMYEPASNPFYNAKAPHDFSVLNDWAQEHPLVEQQWADMLRYWLTEYNVDGFRFDLVKGLGDSDSYGSGTQAYNASRVARMKRLHAVISEVKPDAIHINEHFADTKEENEMAADGQLLWSNMNNASCQVAMGYQSDSNTSGFYAPNNGGRLAGSTVSYAESHDEERMGYKQAQWGATEQIKRVPEVKARRLGSVAAMMLATPGSHMIWQFQELGADQTTKNADGSNNTDAKNVVWWRASDPVWSGLQQSYKELIFMRNHNPELFGAEASVTMNYNGWGIGRFIRLNNGDKELVLMVNPDVNDATISVDVNSITADNMQILSASHDFAPQVTAADSRLACSIPAGAYVVVATANTTGCEDITDDLTGRDCTVYGTEGRIVIEGSFNSAIAYTLSGVRVGLDNLAPGIYVAVVDGKSHKIIVK